MEPNELVSYAIEKAKANLRYVLERAEFLLEHPIVDIDSALIDSFTEYCIRYLGDSFRRNRKGHYGPTDSNCIIGDNFYYWVRTGNTHQLFIPGIEPVNIRWVPEDIEAILQVFDLKRSSFEAIVEGVVSEFRARCKASEIAEISVQAIMGDYIFSRGYKLRILCSSCGDWNCILYSDEHEVGKPFISNPEKIRFDIERILP